MGSLTLFRPSSEALRILDVVKEKLNPAAQSAYDDVAKAVNNSCINFSDKNAADAFMKLMETMSSLRFDLQDIYIQQMRLWGGKVGPYLYAPKDFSYFRTSIRMPFAMTLHELKEYLWQRKTDNGTGPLTAVGVLAAGTLTLTLNAPTVGPTASFPIVRVMSQGNISISTGVLNHQMAGQSAVTGNNAFAPPNVQTGQAFTNKLTPFFLIPWILSGDVKTPTPMLTNAGTGFSDIITGTTGIFVMLDALTGDHPDYEEPIDMISDLEAFISANR